MANKPNIEEDEDSKIVRSFSFHFFCFDYGHIVHLYKKSKEGRWLTFNWS